MSKARALGSLVIGVAGLALSGCGGGDSKEHDAEMLHELRARTTVYKPVATDSEAAPGLSEPFVRVWSVQQAVADALGRIGPDAVPALVKALSHPDAEVRVECTRALALIGAPAEAAVPELTRRLKDDNEQVRRGAARALGQIGPHASAAVPALLELLEAPVSRQPASDQQPAADQPRRAG